MGCGGGDGGGGCGGVQPVSNVRESSGSNRYDELREFFLTLYDEPNQKPKEGEDRDNNGVPDQVQFADILN